MFAQRDRFLILRIPFVTFLAVCFPEKNLNAAVFEMVTIALSGKSDSFGPGLGPGVSFRGFSGSATMNSDGSVAFLGAIQRDGNLDREGYWVNSGDRNNVIVLTHEGGAMGPGLGNGIVFENLVAIPNIGNGNGVIVSGFLAGTGVVPENDYVLSLHSSGVNDPFARSGVATGLGPGLGDNVVFQNFFVSPEISSANTPLFNATLTGSGLDTSNRSGIWKHRSGSNVLLARTGIVGSFGPSLDSDTVFSGFQLGQIQNGTDTVYLSSFTKNLASGTTRVGIWKNIGSHNSAIALSDDEGSLGPGLGSGQRFAHDKFIEFDINNQGDLAWAANLQDGTQGIWRNFGKGNEPIALSGRTDLFGPGLGTSDMFSVFNSKAIVNESGKILFDAILSDSRKPGLWLNSGDRNEVIAIGGNDGDLGPQLGPGIFFTEFNSLAINSSDTVFFTANLSPGVSRNRHLGLWAYHKGQIHKIVVFGDSFDVDPSSGSDYRTITTVTIPQGTASDSDGGTLTENNEAVFQLSFNDGSVGIFTVTLLVPEPATWSMLLASISILVMRRNCNLQ